MSMPQIDVATIFAISAVIDVVLGALLTYVYFTERTYEGFKDWMIGSVCQACGFVLLTTRQVVPTIISSLLASALLVASGAFFLSGVRRYARRSGNVRIDEWVVYVVAVVSFAYYLFVSERTGVRIAIFSICLAYVMVKGSVCSARDLIGPYRSDGRLLGMLFAATALMNATRGTAALLAPVNTDAELLQRGPVESVPLIVGIALVVCFAGTFLAINGKRLRLDLEAAHAQVRQLEGIIPICMYCKKIRDDANSWHRLEQYLAEHSHASFSHGICPDCELKFERDLTDSQLM